LQNEEFHILYCSANIIRVIRAGHVAWAGGKRNVNKALVGKGWRKETTSKTLVQREDTLKMELLNRMERDSSR
jgi:hypothetical protein